jgi:Zn finger protein HypA/HybF involved in hydrogenase expression
MSKRGSMSPGFKQRLQRAVSLYLRELQDGCVDCIELNRRNRGGVTCPRCSAVAADIVKNPAKYVRVESDVAVRE